MFIVKLEDGTLIQATSVEEDYRPEQSGTAFVSLTLQNSDASENEALDIIKPLLTAEALGSIQIFTKTDDKHPIKTYKGYKYIHYLVSRLQSDGRTLLDMNFTKEDFTI